MFKKVLAVAFASAFFVGTAWAENPNKNKKEAAFGSENCFIGGGMCKLSRGKNPPNTPNYEKTGCFGDYCFWREKPKWKLNQEERERRKKEQPFEIVDLNEYGGGGSQGKNKNKSNDSNHQKTTNKPKQDKPSRGSDLGSSINGALEGLNGLLKPKPGSSSGSGSAGGGSSGGGSGSAGGGSSGGGSGSDGGGSSGGGSGSAGGGSSGGGSGSAGGGSSGGSSGSAGGGSSGGGGGSAGGAEKSKGYWYAYYHVNQPHFGDTPESACSGPVPGFDGATFRFDPPRSCLGVKGNNVWLWSVNYLAPEQIAHESQCNKGYREITKKSGGTFSVVCTVKPKNSDLGSASVGSLGSDSSKSDSGSSSPSSAGGSSSASSGGRASGAGGKSEPANSDAGTADGGKSDGGKSDGGKSDGGKSDGGKSDGGKSDGGKSDGGKSDGGKSDGGNSDGGKSGNGQGDSKGDGEGEDSGGNCKYIPDWLCTADADPNNLDFSGITEGIKEVEAGSAYEYDSRFSESGKCPEPASVSLSGFEIQISYDFVCQFMEKIRFVVLAAFAMISVFIVLKAID